MDRQRMDRRRFVEGVGAAVSWMACSAVWAQGRRPVETVVGMRGWNPLAFGAKGDGLTDDTRALQRTMDACAAAGGGTMVLPGGHTFLSGTLTLRPHVELHLAGGTTLRATADRDAFRALGSLLFAKDARDIHVSGTGTMDGSFAAFFPAKGPEGYPVPSAFLGPYDPLNGPEALNPADGRPRMILLVNCRGVMLEGFTIRDSPTWTIHAVGCEGVLIEGISILNSLEVPNCDGIDIDHCREVRVEGCDIVAGDDCLVVKASRNFGEYGPCEGVTMTNCTLESSSAGIKVEAEGPYPVRSVMASNCSMVRCNRGISFLNRDGATVEDLIFSDMTIETKMRTRMWWGSGEPVAMSSVPRVKGGPAGMVRGVQFNHLECRSESGIYLRGTVGAPLRDVSFRGIELAIAKTTAMEGGYYDMRPGDAFGESGMDRRATAGFFAAEVDGLRLSGVDVRWGGVVPEYYGAALELHDCAGVSMEAITGQAAHAGEPAVVLEGVAYAKDLAATR